MLDRPKISIIIPTYNSGHLLEVAMLSLMNQSFRNFEVLIMDGLSTDNTLEVARKYQTLFPNISIHSKSDYGAYDAMNKGIRIAKGKWVYFLGSDDYLIDNKVLSEFERVSKLSNADMIYGNVFFEPYGLIYDGKFTYSKIVNKNICHQGIFYKKALFEKFGLFNLEYPVHADWEFNMKCFFSSKVKVQYHDWMVAHFSEGGLSSSEDKFRDDMLNFLLMNGIGKLSMNEFGLIVKRYVKLKLNL